MDRSLLERMIGATVLVILLVVVAPALLDGQRDEPPAGDEVVIRNAPPAEQTRIETITLNSQPAPSEPRPVAEPAPKAERPAESSKAKPVVRTDPPPPAGQWMVQLGSFSGRDNAQKFADQLKGDGFPALVVAFRSGNKAMYRVQVGPRPDRPQAERLQASLQKAGHKGIVMPVSP